MYSAVKQIRNSTFIRHNAIFFIGSLSVGLLNYLFYPILGRLLNPGSFGEVQTISSLFAQIAIFLSVLGLITVNIVANYEDRHKRNKVILELERLAAVIGIALLLITFTAGPYLQSFFHFSSVWPFQVLALAVLVSVPLTFRGAYLRGIKLFGTVSVIGVIASAADIVFAAVFVLAGLGTTGAILGLVAGQLLALGYAAQQAQRRGFGESWRSTLFRLPDLKLIKPELKYALLVLVGSLCITGMYSIDIIVVKHYFNAQTAGLYAGISTVARIIFFLTGSIAGVLLPAIKLKQKPRDNQMILLKSFGLLVLVGGSALIVFSIFPNEIIKILMGSKYLPYSYLLPRLSLALFIISILNLIVLYFIALRRYGIAPVVIIGLAITYGILKIEHQTLQAVINSLFYGSLVMLGLLGAWLGTEKLKN
jgi:O-antigen/teichoic acid export membrane protein